LLSEPLHESALTWGDADDVGPEPHPTWLADALAADPHTVDRGLLKSGKEADVHVVELRSGSPHGPVVCLLADKRYRPGAGRGDRHDPYRAGRSALGRFTIAAAGGWAELEFALLAALWEAGVAVPLPIRRTGDSFLLELVGDQRTGEAAPRLVQSRPDRADLLDLWGQARQLFEGLVDAGVAHGDLSPYNLLLQGGRLVMIDLPQAVDLLAHPGGLDLFHRDCVNVATWFRRRGLADDVADPEALFADLLPRVWP
jgi:RIO kinase 1